MLRDATLPLGKKGSTCFKKDGLIYIKNELLGDKLGKKYGRYFSAKDIAAYFRKNISLWFIRMVDPKSTIISAIYFSNPQSNMRMHKSKRIELIICFTTDENNLYSTIF